MLKLTPNRMADVDACCSVEKQQQQQQQPETARRGSPDHESIEMLAMACARASSCSAEDRDGETPSPTRTAVSFAMSSQSPVKLTPRRAAILAATVPVPSPPSSRRAAGHVRRAIELAADETTTAPMPLTPLASAAPTTITATSTTAAPAPAPTPAAAAPATTTITTTASSSPSDATPVSAAKRARSPVQAESPSASSASSASSSAASSTVSTPNSSMATPAVMRNLGNGGGAPTPMMFAAAAAGISQQQLAELSRLSPFHMLATTPLAASQGYLCLDCGNVTATAAQLIAHEQQCLVKKQNRVSSPSLSQPARASPTSAHMLPVSVVYPGGSMMMQSYNSLPSMAAAYSQMQQQQQQQQQQASPSTPYLADNSNSSHNNSMHMRNPEDITPEQNGSCKGSVSGGSRKRGSSRKQHMCNICGKSFGYGFVLTKHLRTHTGEKPYKCETCDRSFSDFSTLRNHRRIHSGEKPYKCDTCGRAFRQIGQVRTHQRVHESTNINTRAADKHASYLLMSLSAEDPSRSASPLTC